MKKILIAVCCAATILNVSRCTKEPLKNLTESEGRIYITNHDESVNFGNYQTFSIADSAAVIENNQFVGRALASVDAAYIDAVQSEMQQRGYTLVGRNDNPDLALNVN